MGAKAPEAGVDVGSCLLKKAGNGGKGSEGKQAAITDTRQPPVHLPSHPRLCQTFDTRLHRVPVVKKATSFFPSPDSCWNPARHHASPSPAHPPRSTPTTCCRILPPHQKPQSRGHGFLLPPSTETGAEKELRWRKREETCSSSTGAVAVCPAALDGRAAASARTATPMEAALMAPLPRAR
jgi:hypothetical protein